MSSRQHSKTTKSHRGSPSPPPADTHGGGAAPYMKNAAPHPPEHRESTSSSPTPMVGSVRRVQAMESISEAGDTRSGGMMSPPPPPPPVDAALDDGASRMAVATPPPPLTTHDKRDLLSELPDDLLSRILHLLDIDSVVHCSMLSTRYPCLLDDKIYRVLCVRTYLDQSQNKQLNLFRFKTWKTMLLERPRVRLNGVYSLESSYIKKPMRDMWTEVAAHSILEVKYWRYLRFLPQNRLLYACTPSYAPHDAVRLLKDQGRHKDVVGGQYYVNKGEVHCRVLTSYAVIIFRLSIQHGQRGHFSQLVLQEHSSIPINDPTATPIPHRVTTFETFLYKRVPQFSSSTF